MNHSFNIEDAKLHGVECAIILNNIRYWIEYNKANRKNIYDGRVWTYNSVRAYSELFPYWTADQIRRYFEKLEKCGAIITGNYNKRNGDRTKWHSIPGDEALCQLADSPEHLANSPDRIGENAKPLPDINADINADAAAADFSLAGKGLKPTKTIKESKVKKARDFSSIEPVLKVLREYDANIEKAISINTQRMIEHEIEENGVEFVSDAVYGRILTVKGTGKPLALTTFFDPDRAEWRADMAREGERLRLALEGLKMASQRISQPVIEYSEGEYIENPWQTSNI